MPIPLPPTTYHCPACHWSKTVAPRSDVLMPGDSFESCPACGHAGLDRRVASTLDALQAHLLRGLKSLQR